MLKINESFPYEKFPSFECRSGCEFLITVSFKNSLEIEISRIILYQELTRKNRLNNISLSLFPRYFNTSIFNLNIQQVQTISNHPSQLINAIKGMDKDETLRINEHKPPRNDVLIPDHEQAITWRVEDGINGGKRGGKVDRL